MSQKAEKSQKPRKKPLEERADSFPIMCRSCLTTEVVTNEERKDWHIIHSPAGIVGICPACTVKEGWPKPGPYKSARRRWPKPEVLYLGSPPA